jgi:streptogramin lyase
MVGFDVGEGFTGRLVRLCVIVGLASALAACATDGGADSVRSTTSATRSATNPPASTVAPTTSIAPEGIVTDEMEILPSVDWLAVDERGVWAKLEPGLVYLIDPDTNKVSAQVEVGGEQCQGLGVGDGSVWACVGRNVVRIDPDTEEVLATVPVGKAYSQGELPVSSGKTWVLIGDGSSLLPIDTATNVPGTPIALPARGTDLGAGPSGVWIVSSLDNAVIHVDPSTGTVLGSTDAARPMAVAVDDDQVWVAGVSETVRIDPSTGAIDLTVPFGSGADGGIALTDDTVWLRNTNTFLTRLDRSTGTLIDDENTTVYAEIAGRLTSGGDIVVGFGSIWTSAYDDRKLFRISTGRRSTASSP